MQIIKIKAKRAFTPTKIPGADYVLNQYIGCAHACKYCYASFMCRWYKYGKWGQWVVVKENAPELVKKENVRGTVYMSSVSDPYQPIESNLKLTRAVLQNMHKDTRLGILTKSDLVLRDIDIFKQFKDIEVGLTINNLDKEIEPFAPSNKRRIIALKQLCESGVKTYAFISPIIPHFTDIESLIRETKKFVDFYWFEFLNLRASAQFKSWLKEKHPRGFETLVNKEKLDSYIHSLLNLIKKHKIVTIGICIHARKYSPMK